MGDKGKRLICYSSLGFVNRPSRAFSLFIHFGKCCAASYSTARGIEESSDDDIPSHLARWTVHLTRPAPAKGGKRRHVHLVGVRHKTAVGICNVELKFLFSTERCDPTYEATSLHFEDMLSCVESRAAINYVIPKAVFLELCEARRRTLSRPGSEFHAANEEAKRLGCKVILGDRDYQETFRRTVQALNPSQRVIFLEEYERTKKMPLHLFPEEVIYPIRYERDAFMARGLIRLSEDHSSIVTVVGRAHLSGIELIWNCYWENHSSEIEHTLGNSDDEHREGKSLLHSVEWACNILDEVSLHLVKSLYARFVDWDQKIIDQKTGTPAHATNTTVSEDLGQVEYILADKERTLTENKMIFRRCCISGKFHRNESGDALKDVELLNAIESGSQDVIRFLTVTAICNTVIPVQSETGAISYMAESRDEDDLVLADAKLHMVLVERNANILGKQTGSFVEAVEQYSQLRTLCLSWRELLADEYHEWSLSLKEDSSSLVDRELNVENSGDVSRY